MAVGAAGVLLQSASQPVPVTVCAHPSIFSTSSQLPPSAAAHHRQGCGGQVLLIFSPGTSTLLPSPSSLSSLRMRRESTRRIAQAWVSLRVDAAGARQQGRSLRSCYCRCCLVPLLPGFDAAACDCTGLLLPGTHPVLATIRPSDLSCSLPQAHAHQHRTAAGGGCVPARHRQPRARHRHVRAAGWVCAAGLLGGVPLALCKWRGSTLHPPASCSSNDHLSTQAVCCALRRVAAIACHAAPPGGPPVCADGGGWD